MALVQVVSLRAIVRYVAPQPWVGVCLAVVIGALALALVGFIDSRRETKVIRRVSSRGAIALLLVVAASVSWWIHPIADGLRAEGRGSDQDDALRLGATNLVAHGDPYRERTYFGNPISPGPGWIAFVAPLSLAGLYPLLFPLSLVLFVSSLGRLGARDPAVLQSLVVLGSGLGTWESLAVGGDLIPLGVGLMACLPPLAAGSMGPGSTALHAVLSGTLLTGRIVLAVLLPVWAGVAWRLGRRASAVWLAAVGSLALLAWHGLFAWRTADYTPAHLLAKGPALLREVGVDLGAGALALLAILSGLAIVVLVRFADAFGGSAGLRLCRSSAWVLTPPLGIIALVDLAGRGFDLSTWEGSNYLLVTLPVWLAIHALSGAESTGAS